MPRQIQRMQARADVLRLKRPPHVKTTQCLDVVAAQAAAGARGITLSILKEAELFFAVGVKRILYTVGILHARLPRAGPAPARL